jgi:hypothetical protein
MADLYISGDIEADGPIPGRYSMLAFGLAVAGTYDSKVFEARDPRDATFYRELVPISDSFDPQALAVAGLDRDALTRTGVEPAAAMREATAWIRAQASGAQPVLVGYPVVFDWMFLYWYFVQFAGESPFGFSSALDMKTMYQQKAGVMMAAAGRADLPEELVSDRPHTHHALDDAVEQADVFARLFIWEGRP